MKSGDIDNITDTCQSCGHWFAEHVGGENCEAPGCACTWFDTIGGEA